MSTRTIQIRGARTHNLRGIDLDLPRDKLVVLTGLSGSGKSSLAFDTLYAEGQRRYVESLSAYARQFLSMMEKPDVDHIEGLSPAISIEQKSTSHNPRSTVGTVTEIYDYLRLLYARAGIPRCPDHGDPARGAERLADGRRRARAAGRHEDHGARADREGPQGRVRREARRAQGAGLPARAHRRRGRRARRPAEARRAQEARHRRRRRPARGEARHSAAARRKLRDGAEARRRRRARRVHGGSRRRRRSRSRTSSRARSAATASASSSRGSSRSTIRRARAPIATGLGVRMFFDAARVVDESGRRRSRTARSAAGTTATRSTSR